MDCIKIKQTHNLNIVYVQYRVDLSTTL